MSVFAQSLTTQEKLSYYSTKALANPRSIDVKNETIQQIKKYDETIQLYQFLTDPQTIAPATTYDFVVPLFTSTHVILKNIIFTFTIPGASFGGAPDTLGSLSASPIENVDIRYANKTVTSITKRELFFYNNAQNSNVQNICDVYFTSGDVITANASTTTLLIPFPLAEAFCLNDIVSNQLVLRVRTTTLGQYGTTVGGAVTMAPIVSGGYLQVIERNDFIPRMPNMTQRLSYVSLQEFELLNFLCAAAGETHQAQINVNYPCAALHMFLTATNINTTPAFWTNLGLITSWDIFNNSNRKILGSTDLTSGNGYNVVQEFARKLNEEKQALRLNNDILIDFSNYTYQEYEDYNILCQNSRNLNLCNLSVTMAGLTPGVTYWIYLIAIVLSPLEIEYNDGKIREIRTL